MNPVTLVSPAALAAASAFASTDPARPTLRCVHVATDGALQATDGHRAVRIRPQFPPGDVHEYPTNVVPEGQHAPDGNGLLVPREVALKFAKTAKTLSGKSAHPVLRAVAVSTNAASATLQATNLDSIAREDFRTPEGTLPSLQQVWPTKAPVLRIGLDARMLAEIVTALASLTDSRDPMVVMEFHGPLAPCVLRCGGGAEALLMPCRLPDAVQAQS